jgi:hypothetical protein
MKLSKLPKKRTVTISDLLHTSDMNTSIDTIMGTLNDVCEKSRKFKNLFIMSEDKDGSGKMWRVGYNSKDMIYLAEIIKTQAMSEDDNFIPE